MNVNTTTIRPLSFVKSLLVTPGRRPRRIPGGPLSGLTLNLDLAYETQIYLGLAERETYRYIGSVLGTCDWLIDVGAGKGELSLLFASQQRNVRVVACEPQQNETAILRSNIELNSSILPNEIEIVERYIGTGEGPDAVRLDDIEVDRFQRGLIKIDVDHFEMDVLRSGRELLASPRVSALIETHSPALERECLAFLEQLGFECRIIKNAWWRLIVPERRVSESNRWLWAERKA